MIGVSNWEYLIISKKTCFEEIPGLLFQNLRNIFSRRLVDPSVTDFFSYFLIEMFLSRGFFRYKFQKN